MGRIFDFLKRYFGFGLHSEDHVYTLGAAVIPIAGNGPDRPEIIFTNPSANNAWIYYTSDVAAGVRGFLLAANGGIISFNARDDGDLSGRQWWGIAAAGAPVIDVTEVVADS